MSDKTLTSVVQKKHHLVEQDIDRDAVARVRSFSLPTVEVGPQALSAGISRNQASLVANNAARSVCRTIAKYSVIEDSDKADAQIRLVITSVVPTGRSSAGASSVLGLLSPVPLRLPVGLGAFAAAGEVLAADRSQIAIMHWARGANSITNSAKVSTIGDAWQLAAKFGEDFAHGVVDSDPQRSGIQRASVQPGVRNANQIICDARFGKVSVAGKGMSFLLPLSPEAIDAGAPGTGSEAAPAPH